MAKRIKKFYVLTVGVVNGNDPIADLTNWIQALMEGGYGELQEIRDLFEELPSTVGDDDEDYNDRELLMSKVDDIIQRELLREMTNNIF